MDYYLGVEVEETHVPDEKEQLVEADVLVSLLFTFLFPANASCLDVPYPDWHFLNARFDPDFLVDGFEESSLPPVSMVPNLVVPDQFVELHLAPLLVEVVGHGEDHEHLRVVGIEFMVALNGDLDTTSRNARMQEVMHCLLLTFSSNSLLILNCCRHKMKSFLIF